MYKKLRSSIDDIAFRVARDFNEIQNNGKDLTGKLGNDMFILGLPKLEKNLIAGSDLQVSLDQINSVVNFKENIDFSFDGSKWIDNKNKSYKGDLLIIMVLQFPFQELL